MRTFVAAVAILLGLLGTYVLAHWALIEVGKEVVVLRTESTAPVRLEALPDA